MLYLKIIGEDTHYNLNSFTPFTTQHGYKAVRFDGDEIPTTNKGFKIYNDNDDEISDLSKYKYEYRQNEYSEQEDIFDLPLGSDEPLPLNSLDMLNKKINAVNRSLNNKITKITPYEVTKTAYYSEKEKVFYDVPNGNLSVFFDNYNGGYTVNKVANRTTITFIDEQTKEVVPLKDTTNITLMVQQ